MGLTLDLNCDLGEGVGDDDALLGLVSSANVACGYHAGDDTTMRRVCEAAVARGVAVGAHVSYLDPQGFGRRRVEVDGATLRRQVLDQIAVLDGHARAAGDRVRYVKPHGALYHAAGQDEEHAAAVVGAVRDYGTGLAVMGLPGSLWLRWAEDEGLPVVHEAFADRAYAPDGTLVPRGRPDAVLDDPDEVARRCVAMATGEPITDVNGDPLVVRPDSVCVHGDTPGAVEVARRVRTRLEAAGVALVAFAR